MYKRAWLFLDALGGTPRALGAFQHDPASREQGYGRPAQQTPYNPWFCSGDTLQKKNYYSNVLQDQKQPEANKYKPRASREVLGGVFIRRFFRLR
jgi:hypothetical protein